MPFPAWAERPGLARNTGAAELHTTGHEAPVRSAGAPEGRRSYWSAIEAGLQGCALFGRGQRRAWPFRVPKARRSAARVSLQHVRHGGGALLADQIVGIEPVGQEGELHALAGLQVGQGGIDRAEGSLLARAVAVEAERGHVAQSATAA